MREPLPGLERMATGIPGLDRVLGGGLPVNGVYMVEGPPGAGKTLLGNQLCFAHAERGLQSIYLTLLAESHSRMIAHLSGLSFFRPEQVAKSVYYLSGFKMLESQELDGLARTTRETVSARQASLLVIDGLVSAVESARTNRAYKKFIHELQVIAAMARCTVVLLASTGRKRRGRQEHTMVDGIIELSADADDLRGERHLQVRKLRGTDPVRGKHTLVISQHGVSVRPRIEAELLRRGADANLRPGTARVDFSVAGLDQMLAGGLPEHSTTMLMGPSGSGKTLLGLQFLATGADKGEPGLHFGFFERPKTLTLKAARIGMQLGRHAEQGLVQLLWEPYGEGTIDALGERLLRSVREHRPKRMFIDGLHGFEPSVESRSRLGGVFSAIAEELEGLHVTTVYTLESTDLFGHAIASPIRGVSAITHNIILLRYTELDARVLRAITVLKLRDSWHDARIRELDITDSGFVVLDSFGAALGVLTGAARRAEPPSGPAQSAEPLVASAQSVSHERDGARRADLPQGGAPRGRVLIVDDEFGLSDVVADILSERGYETAIAINGELGLQALREKTPDIVLLDVMMPVLSGPEMLERMKADPARAAIPVVLMTALPQEVPPETAALCDAVLQKPFSPDQLFAVLERLLGAQHAQRG